MKKLLFTLVCVFSVSLFAQETDTMSTDNVASMQEPVKKKKKIQFGIKGGLNYVTLINDGDYNLDLDYKLAGYGGFILDVPISSLFAIQPELTYTSQGSQRTRFNGKEDNVNLDYISLGLAAKIFPSQDDHFHFLAGFTFDYNLQYDLINVINDNVDDNAYFIIDWGLFAGVGVQFDNGLGFEARYKRGVLDITNDYSLDWGDDDNNPDDEINRNALLFNSVFQFGITYRFSAKK